METPPDFILQPPYNKKVRRSQTSMGKKYYFSCVIMVKCCDAKCCAGSDACSMFTERCDGGRARKMISGDA